MINRCYISMFLMLLTGCLDEIRFNPPDQPFDAIVINGRLVHGNPANIQVNIAAVIDLDDPGSGLPIADATVMLIDDNGASITIDNFKDGFYQTDITSLLIEVNKAYKIQVTTIDGASYESSLEVLNPVPPIDTAMVALTRRDELNNAGNIESVPYAKFTVNSPLSDGPHYLKWDFESVYKFQEYVPPEQTFPPNVKICYINRTINLANVEVFAGTGPITLAQYELFEEKINHRLAFGMYLTIYQQSLSSTAYDYWNRLGGTTTLDASLFANPPGQVIGNIVNINNPEELVFGYFYTTQQDTFRLYIDPDAVGNPTPFCNDPSASTDDLCQDCLNWNNSSLEKPPFWVN